MPLGSHRILRSALPLLQEASEISDNLNLPEGSSRLKCALVRIQI